MLSYDTGRGQETTLSFGVALYMAMYSEGKFTTEYHQILPKHTHYIIPSLDSEMMYL